MEGSSVQVSSAIGWTVADECPVHSLSHLSFHCFDKGSFLICHINSNVTVRLGREEAAPRMKSHFAQRFVSFKLKC